MRVVMLHPNGDVREVNRKTSFAKLTQHVFGRSAANLASVCVRRADNREAAVVAYGLDRRMSVFNECYERLLDVEVRRRGGAPTEFLVGTALGGIVLLVVESIAGTTSLSYRQYRELRAGLARLGWLEAVPMKPPRGLTSLAESPAREQLE